jgi:hypothetical protein
MGARFSNGVLQTLLVLFGRRPPKVCPNDFIRVGAQLNCKKIGPAFAHHRYLIFEIHSYGSRPFRNF